MYYDMKFDASSVKDRKGTSSYTDTESSGNFDSVFLPATFRVVGSYLLYVDKLLQCF